MQEVIRKVEKKVKELLEGEHTGHDWYHIKQVRDMALRIAQKEGGNKDLIELVALIHDVGDRKFHGSEEMGHNATMELLETCGVSDEIAKEAADIAHRVSFKGAGVKDDMPSLEGKIVQDADRLYALGAIGIARAFAYGGKKGRLIYDPEEQVAHAKSSDEYYNKGTSSLNHFHEKLLHLKERMHTKTAKEIAQKRDRFLRDFLGQFMAEWEGKD